MRSLRDWEAIRAEYEVGASQSALSRRYGISRTAIQKKIKSEGWTQDVTGSIKRLAEAKVAGVATACNPKKKAAAIDAAAEEIAAVVLRHRAEWDDFTRQFDEARASGDFEELKKSKITAETMRIKQDGERKAWGFPDSRTQVEVAGDMDVAATIMEARNRVRALR